VSYCTPVSYCLPVDLLWLPSGALRPPPLHKVSEDRLPFLDDYLSGNRKARTRVCRQATITDKSA